MFKISDKVVFCKSSLESGMIDSKEGDVFTIQESYGPGSRVVSLKELSGYYHKTHFEHYIEKEKVMEKYIPEVGDKVKGFVFDGTTYPGIGYSELMDDVVGEQGIVQCIYEDRFEIGFSDNWWTYPLELAHLAKIENTPQIEESPQETLHEDAQTDWEGSQIDWQVGQEVWDVLHGKGCVKSVATTGVFCVYVDFGRVARLYNKDGVVESYPHEHMNRSLFFSEPKIIAETKPPKKPFTPVFKQGETVVAKKKDGQNTVVFYVDKETELSVESTGCGYPKALYNFYKIGEEVKFS